MSPNRPAASPRAQIPSIVLTGGGSGGHITPLLSLAHGLKKQNPKCKLTYIGLKGEKIGGLKDRYGIFDQVGSVTSGKFRRYHGQSFLARLVDFKTLFLNVVDFFKVMAGFWSARRQLKKIRPDLVFSKGGFVAVPVGLAAKTLKIPLVTHDSDSLPGLANKIVGRWAVLHTTGMAGGHFPYPPQTIVNVGIPVDDRIKPVSKSEQKRFKLELGLPENCKLLLVGGAGLGSETINNLLINSASKLLTQTADLFITLLTGSKDLSRVSQEIQTRLPDTLLPRIQILDFTAEFYKYTGAADLVVSRAGATTIAELAAQHKACILIPAPFLTDGHQLKNTEALKRDGAVEILNDKVSPDDFSSVVTRLINSDTKLSQMASKLGATARPQAAEHLAKLLLEIATT